MLQAIRSRLPTPSLALPGGFGDSGAPLRRPSRFDLWTVGLPIAGAALLGLLAAAGLWIVGVGLILMAAFVPLTLANPERMAMALIVVLPWMIYPLSVGGFSIFLAIPTFGFTSLVLLMRQRRGATRVVAHALPVKLAAIFLTTAVVASATASEPLTSFSKSAYLVLFAFFAWAVASALVSGTLTRERVSRAVLTSAAVAAAVLIFQFAAQFAVGQSTVLSNLFSVNLLFGGENAPLGRNWVLDSPDLVRGIVPFMTPPSAGQYLMLAAIVGFWLRSERRRTSSARSTVETVMLALVVVGLLVTFSRQSWIGAGLGVLALGLIRRPIWMLTACTAALVVAFAVPFPGGEGGTFGEHLLEASDTSSQSNHRRMEIWGRSIDNIPENVIVGVGPGLFETTEPDPVNPATYAHNVFLNVAIEVGLIGALALIGILILSMRAALQRGQRLPFALLIAFIVASLFDDALYFPRNGLVLALAFALILGGESSKLRRRQEAPAVEVPDAPDRAPARPNVRHEPAYS